MCLSLLAKPDTKLVQSGLISSKFFSTVPIARSAVRKPISMVAWEAAPGDLSWAKMAWDALGLNAHSINAGCVFIPAAFTPDRSKQWAFCSTAATHQPGENDEMACFALPMNTEGRNIYISNQKRWIELTDLTVCIESSSKMRDDTPELLTALVSKVLPMQK